VKAPENPTLAGRAGRALGWSLVNTIAARLGTFAIGVALARMLGPAEFGTFAVALVALLAVLSFNELGVSLAIVRWPTDPREIAPTVATISTLASVAIFAVCMVGAPAFCDAMGSPGATNVVRLLSVNVIISGLVATPAALMQREFQGGRRLIIDQVGNWLSALVSIGAAVAGMGAISLALGRIAGASASGGLFFAMSSVRVGFGFDRAIARRLVRFGLPLAGASIVVFSVTYVDQFIVGSLLGPVALGFYVLAFNLASWPINVFSQPVRQVSPAALARLHGDLPAMRSAFLSSLALLAAITLPICAVLAGAAGPIIHLVYGEAWAAAAPVLVWLCLLAALRIPFELIYDYFVVLGRARVVFTVQFLWFLALIPALYAGASVGGTQGAAAAHVAVALLVVLPVYLYELRRAGFDARALGMSVLAPVACAAAAGVVAGITGEMLHIDLLGLAVAGAAGLSVLALQARRMRATLRRLRAVVA
jgi:O-antigen/teichoic acid export membrane protein